MSVPPDCAMQGPTALAALDGILRNLSLRCQVFFRGQLCDSWSLDTSGSGHVNFHVVCKGLGWLRLPGWAEPQRVMPGDVIVLPNDSRHQLASVPDLPVRFGASTIERQVPMGQDSQGTSLVCGYVLMDSRNFGLIFAAMPSCLIIRAEQDKSGFLRSLVNLLFAQASNPLSNSTAVIDRLAEVLILHVIGHVAITEPGSSGLLASLHDPRLSAAMCAVIESPQQEWSIDALASLTHLSRSAFTTHFSAVVGKAPIEFLRSWRMQLANRWLQVDRLCVAEVAERCGYRSEAAFAKAYKRETGLGPGAMRRVF